MHKLILTHREALFILPSYLFPLQVLVERFMQIGYKYVRWLK